MPSKVIDVAVAGTAEDAAPGVDSRRGTCLDANGHCPRRSSRIRRRGAAVDLPADHAIHDAGGADPLGQEVRVDIVADAQ